MKSTAIQIGVIRGGGSGNLLSNIFKDFLSAIANKHGIKVLFKEDLKNDNTPYIYHSFKSLVEAVGSSKTEDYRSVSKQDVDRLKKVLEEWHLKDKVKAVFRTSINAEALYQFRQEVKAVKEFRIAPDESRTILFIRDEAEGFYANQTYSSTADTINFSGTFTKKHQQEIAEYALNQADKHLKKGYGIYGIYKHHLFGNQIESWLTEKIPTIQMYQPDHGMIDLFSLLRNNGLYGELNQPNTGMSKDLLVICGNEVGDFIYEQIISVLNVNARLELYSRNIYLNNPFKGDLVGFQTVHGSADDKEDPEEIIPNATLRIAAAIAEDYLGIEGIEKDVDQAITFTKIKSLNKNSEILNFVYKELNLKKVNLQELYKKF